MVRGMDGAAGADPAMAVRVAATPTSRHLLAPRLTLRRLRLDPVPDPSHRRLAGRLCGWDAGHGRASHLPDAHRDRPLGALSAGDRGPRSHPPAPGPAGTP